MQVCIGQNWTDEIVRLINGEETRAFIICYNSWNETQKVEGDKPEISISLSFGPSAYGII